MTSFVIENRKLVKFIGNYIDISVPPCVKSIGLNCFAKNENIKSVFLPEGIEEICGGAFAGCTSLTEIYLPKGLRLIGEGAFVSCPSLREIKLPNSLQGIGKMAFCNSGLIEIVIPENVLCISRNAFWKCKSLQKVRIANPDVCIEEDVFSGCYALREGFIAAGYPRERCKEDRINDDLLYSILWCSCIELHSPLTCERAEAFIRKNTELVLEEILRQDNSAALAGLLSKTLLTPDIIDAYLKKAVSTGQTMLTALMLIGIERSERSWEDDFSL